jgi:hypothetical protein
MTKHGIVKRNDVSAEPNSILRVVLIEEAAREYLRGKPQTLRLLLEQHCDASEDAESAEARIGPQRKSMIARGFVG